MYHIQTGVAVPPLTISDTRTSRYPFKRHFIIRLDIHSKKRIENCSNPSSFYWDSIFFTGDTRTALCRGAVCAKTLVSFSCRAIHRGLRHASLVKPFEL